MGAPHHIHNANDHIHATNTIAAIDTSDPISLNINCDAMSPSNNKELSFNSVDKTNDNDVSCSPM